MAEVTEYIVGEESGDTALSAETGAPPRSVDTSDKLRIINRALINTGNNPVDVPDDATDEWRVASSAFEQEVELLLFRRTWNFATRDADLTRYRAPILPGFTDVYAKPPDCLYLQTVYRTDVAAQIQAAGRFVPMRETQVRPPGLEYRIVNDLIYTNAPVGARCVYVPFPVGSQPWSVGFSAVLRMFIESVIYRALNEDDAAAKALYLAAERMLEEVAPRVDSEEPKKALFRSTLHESRRMRRGGYTIR